jgi:hypothetical protein
MTTEIKEPSNRIILTFNPTIENDIFHKVWHSAKGEVDWVVHDEIADWPTDTGDSNAD